MEQRLSLVTLGVEDLEAARSFYEALGWSQRPGTEGVVFFQAGGLVVGVWRRSDLAEDSGVVDSGGIAREPAETFWGGYSGVFVDPDGHPWEVAHNPFWTIADDGSVVL